MIGGSGGASPSRLLPFEQHLVQLLAERLALFEGLAKIGFAEDVEQRGLRGANGRVAGPAFEEDFFAETVAREKSGDDARFAPVLADHFDLALADDVELFGWVALADDDL